MLSRESPLRGLKGLISAPDLNESVIKALIALD